MIPVLFLSIVAVIAVGANQICGPRRDQNEKLPHNAPRAGPSFDDVPDFHWSEFEAWARKRRVRLLQLPAAFAEWIRIPKQLRFWR